MRILACLTATAVTAVISAAPAAAAIARVEGVRFDPEQGAIVIPGAGGLRPLVSHLANPPRMVVDLPGSHFVRSFQSLPGIDGTEVTRVRVAQYQAGVTRVVLDLSRHKEFALKTVGSALLIPVKEALPLASAPAAAPAPEAPAAPPVAYAPTATTPLITGIRYHQGAISVQMDRRAAYWSHVAPGNPTLYTLVFPDTRLAGGLDGASRAINSFNIFRWEAAQDGPDVRITLPMSKAPAFQISHDATSWTFSSHRPAAPVQQASQTRVEDDTTKWSQSVEAPLTFRRIGDRWQMAIRADGRFRYRTTPVGQDRLHLDITGARVTLPRDSVYIDDGLIARVRATPQNGGTRLTIDLDQPVGHAARQLNHDKLLLLTFTRASENRITLDPGHGGSDHGAIGTRGTREKDVTLAIATRLSRLMEAKGMAVQMTRMKDLEILLRPRVDMANRSDSDVFISIHANSFGKVQGVAGIETYYFNDDSYPLAKSVHRHLVKELKRPDRGVRKNNFYVVHHTKMPSALVEIGYLTNPGEEALLVSPAYQERAAQAIFNGIEEFLKNRKVKP
ncbi:MAG: N-acetylmuramoyl-L-alanine amidase [Candidatus Sericytochromatia bacterium]